MKILYWTPLFWPNIGGIETLAYQSLPLLKKRGYEFTVICSSGISDSKENSFHDTPIHQFPMFSALENKNLPLILKISKEISSLKKKFNPDLIHLHFGIAPTLFFHHKTLSSSSAPVLLTLHCHPDDFSSSQLNKETLTYKTFSQSSWITSVSSSVEKGFHSWFPSFKEKSSLITNGLKISSVPFQPIPFSPPTILVLGRLIPVKGVDLALQSFADFLPKFPDSEMVIVGDGPEKKVLKNLAQSLSIEKNVRFKDGVPLEKTQSLINQATVVLIPSRNNEAFGLVALEAAQMGRPVVASRVGGLSEIVKHNQTGYLVEPGNRESIVKSLVDICENPEKTKAMGQKAREHALTQFSFEHFIGSYDELYKKLGKN